MSTKLFSLKQMIANIATLLVSTLIVAYAGLSVYAAVRADDLIFPAPPPSYEDDETILKLDTSDGERISAYYLEVENSERLLLYSHGNGEDIGHIREFLQEFQNRGISVLAYDYPGYGTSTGTPSESSSYASIDAVYEYALNTLGYSPNEIVLYGRSLGGGPSVWLAERKPVASVILDGTYTSTFRVMTHVKLLPWDRFDNYSRLPNIACPILIMHGTADRTIPVSHALRNWAIIQGPKSKLIVEGADHYNLIELAGQEYWNTVESFIKADTE